ncbi:hypothetical protein GCM10010435_24010 [Winogradskya consettensis]|uniref:Uncharacterized protein n=1 Tax=Winogradskya consettensis TaxID=113560 RepID=A0A919VYB0_9ACTN|nr:type I polyketide synthase [Actinoplanes consettensis]GIM82413.1 hypothetical protein Aco04nite_81370 [Actinoplanes consettensis]
MSEVNVGGNEPIAVIGMACRLPGAPNPAAFWQLLSDGGDAIREAPAGRRTPDGGTPRGGYLDDVGHFDAGFFGITADEAGAIDPQQRLALELSWEALEDAGIVPAALRGTGTAVFVGAMAGDYATVTQESRTPAAQHTVTALSRGIIANRVSYRLGLRGASVTVDAGQASSLVAVHLACDALRSGQAGIALAAGVHLNLAPESTRQFEAFGALSPDGRAAVFDAAANGTVRGEGGAVVVLKPYARAVADGDHVYCVIRGSAVNNDGGGATLTTPVAAAQQDVLRAAYQRSGLGTGQVQYVELHGTGTPLGDPIEAEALGAVLGAGRDPADPLVVGSVKTNIGHLEGAAGVAGLVKAVLAIAHRRLPASLHFSVADPRIPLDELRLRVQTETSQWPHPGLPLVAGVSAFGMGGTNCHVTLAEAPAPPVVSGGSEAAAVLWPLSALTEAGMRDQARRLAAYARATADTGTDIAAALATGRTHFDIRAAVVGRDRAELVRELDALATDGPARPGPGALVFACPAVIPAEAALLLADAPVFAAEIAAWNAVAGRPGEIRAVAAALITLWRSYGIEPYAISDGPLAAYFRGELTRDEIARDSTPATELTFRVGAPDATAAEPSDAMLTGGLPGFLTALAGLVTAGYDPDWDAAHAGRPRTRAALPTYAFQRERHWLPDPPDAAPAPAATSELGRLLAPLSPDERSRAVLDVIREQATATGHAFDERSTFKDLGFDSIGSVDLRNRLAAGTGLPLASTVLFDHPTPLRLARHLLERATPAAGTPTGTARAVVDPGDPVVIVGMGCRFAGGVENPDDLWRLLADGGDAIGEFPADRGWDPAAVFGPASGGVLPAGAFLTGAADFDAAFFGISPREATAMDPQQRVLLETAWEAVEHGGIDPAGLRGTATGVFIGATAQEYGPRLYEAPEAIEGHLLTGTTISVASGRIAYVLGTEGPAVTVDTACSSSLVALHLAAQSLRSGECDLALAGGVTVMPSPGMFAEFSRQRGLAPDGRCKAFAEGADGTGWGEGVGVLLLERLSDARSNNHTILAVVRGSAVNQDGASNGLTAPNGPSQERVIRQALASAGLRSSDVDVVEAHGTGTRLGDPIEAQALLATYGQDRDQPLFLGSVKSNIGHTQAAAGVAGVIKMVLAMRHGELPRTLHADTPSSYVDWTTGRIELLTSARPWTGGDRTRRAGISSFGISGTNAHVVIEEPPATPAVAPAADDRPYPWLISAKSPAALLAQAERLSGYAGDAVPDIAAVARGLLSGRAALGFRAAVVARNAAGFVAALEKLEPGAAAVPGDGDVVMVFPGQGGQWLGMAADLLASSPVFAARIADCEAALAPQVDWSLTEVLTGDDDWWMSRVDVVQPVLWAVMVSLAAVWESLGVEISAVIGHSQGEIAAAVVAGALSVEDGALIVTARSRLLRSLAGTGGMVAVGAGRDRVLELLDGLDDAGVAAVNGPTSVVVSGGTAHLDELVARCESAGVWCRRVPVDYASHSAHVDAVKDDLLAALAGVTPRAARVPFQSTVTGARAAGETLDAGYWFENLRRPVRFDDAVRALVADGRTLFVEASPHPVLTAAMSEHAAAVGTLRRDEGGWDQMLRAAGQLWAAGGNVDWTAVLGVATAPPVGLPTYAFQRERYWHPAAIGTADLATAGLADGSHPLLAAAVSFADDDGMVLTGRLSTAAHPWLVDHVVQDRILFPGTGFVELALHAARQAGAGSLRDLTIEAPLMLGDDRVQLQVRVGTSDASGDRTVRVSARPEGSDTWTVHATGVLAPGAAEPGFDLSVWPPPGAEPIDIDDLYPAVARRGLDYGPAFQGLRRAWRSGGDVYADVDLPADPDGYALHPALLDAALHTLYAGDLLSDPTRPALPFAWSGVHRYADGATSLRVHTIGLGADTVALRIADPAGTPVAVVDSLALRPIDAGALSTGAAAVRDSLFAVEWTALPPAPAPSPDRATPVVVAAPGLAAALGLPDTAGVPGDAELVLLSARDTGGDIAGLPGRVRTHLGTLLATLTPLLAGDARIVVVTQRAVPAGGGVEDLTGGAVWGLLRSAQTENPGRIVLADVDGTAASWAALRDAVQRDEPQLALRDGTVLVPRLTRAAAASADAAEAAPVIEGTVLVTGGTGVLGALIAERLVTRHGVRRLVLTGRQGPAAAGAAELVDRLRALGAQAEAVACDAADRTALAGLIAGLPADAPLTGVVHCAGLLADGLFTALTPDRLDRVLRPKADAAVHLHELTAGLGLRWFVAFSSVQATLGGAGQANYAAANGFLDALMSYRRDRGLPGVAMAWGLWAEATGLTAHLGARDLARVGNGLSTEDGLALFDAVLDGPDAHVVPARLDLRSIRERAATGEVPPLLRRLAPPAPRRAATATGGSGLAQRLAALTVTEQQHALLDLVREQAATVLGYPDASAVDPGRVVKDLGLDSLTAVELSNRLAAATGLRLPATLIFTHPTLAAVAEALHGKLTVADAAAPQAPSPATALPSDEPIAIIGMGCRYPGGVEGPDDLWRLVADGVDAIGPFPADRGWDTDALYDPDPDRSGHTYAVHGGFLRDAARFDAGFFGVSPREALTMDPQQRLLLETAWEAFESAGIDPDSARGSRTGVFAGLMYHDYASLLETGTDADGYRITGGAGSVVSGRVSYALALEGPALTVDTACSSSLVATHLAAGALRRGECTMALAGGVTVMATPATFVDFSRQRGLSPDGRCKSFSAAADGTGWSEGSGLLLLERLSDAQRNGHPVLAVIRGSAVNSDGTSNGLTAPNGGSQQRVIAQALSAAGLVPADVDAAEAHGTGTALGDPIEAEALIAAYGPGRAADRPLWLGSLKSNIGHTQAAAGVGAVIKMVMAIRYGRLPRTLHVDAPSPHVDWSSGAVELLTEAREWPGADRPRRAAVSAFGISGTNAHLILEQAPFTAEPAATPPVRGPLPVLLSARSAAALRAQAGRLLDHLGDGPGPDLAELGAALISGRARHEHRAAVLTGTLAGAVDGLAAIRDSDGDGYDNPDVLAGTARDGRLALLFTGQGAQRPGMGRALYERFPVFAAAFDAVAERLDWPLREVMDTERVHETRYTQASLFAIEVAVFRLLESLGIVPDQLLGHSIGELAAAHVAGVLSLDDAVALVAARGRLMQALPAGGAMLAIEADEETVREMIGPDLDLAAVNGPRAVVVSGPAGAVEALDTTGCRTARLTVSHAFHSSLMDPMLDDFRAVAEAVTYHAPRIPIVSNLTGEPITAFDAGYWVRHARGTVRFADGVRHLADQGVTRFLEVGPSGVLTAMAQTTLDGDEVVVAAVLEDEVESLLRAVVTLHVAGVPVELGAVFPAAPRRVALPTYPFQRSRYWPEPQQAAVSRADEAENAFWAAIDRGDVAALADRLPGTDGLETIVPALAAWHRGHRAAAAADALRYRITWTPADLPSGGRVSGTWLVIVPTGVVADDVLAALRAGGADVRELSVDETDLDPARLAGRLHATDARPAGVVALLGPATDPLPGHEAVPAGLAIAVALVRALTDLGGDTPLWCLTRGAVSTGPADVPGDPAQAALWGLGRVAALEQPGLWGGLVDLPAVLDDRAGRGLVEVLATRTEDQVALRDSGVLGRRLIRATPAAPAPDHDDPVTGTVLITGGTGALGAETARWLAAGGTPHLLLVSRRGPDAPGAAELTAELAALGARATVVAADVTDRAALAGLIASVPADLPLTGVVHTAGIVDDAVLTALTPERLDSVLRVKTVAAGHLDDLTAGLGLTMFVLFSSLAGSVGNPGQANYAAANAWLDALAERRRHRGQPATALAWGPWAEAGMAGGADIAAGMRRAGLRPLAAPDALAALRASRYGTDAAVTIADVDWEQFGAGFTAARPSPLLDILAPAGTAPAETGATSHERLAALPAEDRERALMDLVRSRAARILGHRDAAAIGKDRAFRDLGFDSLTAVQLRNLLGQGTGLALAPTLVFDHPTPADLAAYLASRFGDDGPPAVTDEIDRLEAALFGVTPGADVRDAITTRLRDLLDKWNKAHGEPAEAQEFDGDFDQATADEMLELIQREFGSPQ